MKHLTTAEISVIKARIQRGDLYHEIASDYRINQGRLSDLKFGRIFADVPPAELTAPLLYGASNAQHKTESSTRTV